MRARWCWIAILCCAAEAASEPTLLHPRIDIGGRKLALDVRVAPLPARDGGGIQADVDLGPVLAEVRDTIMRQLPRDPCHRHRADNWVARLRRYAAWADGDELWFEVELRVEAWGCVEIHRNELRRQLAHGDLRLRLPLRAQAQAGGLRLRVGRPQVSVRGPLGEAARWYFALRGEELGEALARHAARLDARGLVLSRAMDGLGMGQLESAGFFDAGRPSLRLKLGFAPALPGWFDRIWPWGAAAGVPAQ